MAYSFLFIGFEQFDRKIEDLKRIGVPVFVHFKNEFYPRGDYINHCCCFYEESRCKNGKHKNCCRELIAKKGYCRHRQKLRIGFFKFDSKRFVIEEYLHKLDLDVIGKNISHIDYIIYIEGEIPLVYRFEYDINGNILEPKPVLLGDF